MVSYFHLYKIKKCIKNKICHNNYQGIFSRISYDYSIKIELMNYGMFHKYENIYEVIDECYELSQYDGVVYYFICHLSNKTKIPSDKKIKINMII